jgi:hypothetical protein
VGNGGGEGVESVEWREERNEGSKVEWLKAKIGGAKAESKSVGDFLLLGGHCYIPEADVHVIFVPDRGSTSTARNGAQSSFEWGR